MSKHSLTAVLAVLALAALGMSERPPATLRVHFQVTEGTLQALPVRLINPEEVIYVDPYPEITEKDIQQLHVFQGPDGPGLKITFGMHGRMALETLMNRNKGRYMVVFVNGRPVSVQRVGKIITDGVLGVEGLTNEEGDIFRKAFEKK